MNLMLPHSKHKHLFNKKSTNVQAAENVSVCLGLLPPQSAEQCHVFLFPPEELSDRPD